MSLKIKFNLLNSYTLFVVAILKSLFLYKKRMSDTLTSKIYIFYYKNGSVLNLENIYQPIMAGNVFVKEKNEMIGDDTGDNISDKNLYYSELTGIYWVWKNTQNEVTGSCHYRRYFTAQQEPFLYKIKRLFYFSIGIYKISYGLIYTNNINLFTRRILNELELNNLLTRYDAILPQGRTLKHSVEKHYKRHHDIKDLVIIESILTEKYPEYLNAYKEVLKGKKLYANNMFILKDKDYQEFMKWWFDVLFEFELRINLKNYTDYQKRILGFMAERLLNVWFKYKNLNCVELPVIYFKKFKKIEDFEI